MMYKYIVGAALLAVACATSASGDIVISTHATRNMSCSEYGVCVPTAKQAVLNVNEVENMLNRQSLSVSTANGSIQAMNIEIMAPFSWESYASGLSLDAQGSITFSAVVQSPRRTRQYVFLIGDLSFVGGGRLDTPNVSINNTVYKVYRLNRLIPEINANPTGYFALSEDADAGKLGVFSTSPISVTYSGFFNGLGHTISNLQIVDNSDSFVGLFSTTTGSIRSVSIQAAIIRAPKYAGALVGQLDGTIGNSFSSGTVYGGVAGGLVGQNKYGTIAASQSTASVHGKKGGGGLVGLNEATIDSSFATGKVSGGGLLGGLVSTNKGAITNAYALGAVVGGKRSNYVGGFAGYVDQGSISTSYSTGTVSGAPYLGGFQGGRDSSTDPMDCYWDTDTSGTDQGSGDGNEMGLTGLTTVQFQSGLPTGFDPAIWAEDPNINNGLPYLINNPPPK